MGAVALPLVGIASGVYEVGVGIANCRWDPRLAPPELEFPCGFDAVGQYLEAEHQDRGSIDLPPVQRQLLRDYILFFSAVERVWWWCYPGVIAPRYDCFPLLQTRTRIISITSSLFYWVARHLLEVFPFLKHQRVLAATS